MLFDKFKKKADKAAAEPVKTVQEPDEAPKSALEQLKAPDVIPGTPEEAAAAIWSAERQYLLLSLETADMRIGISFPYVRIDGGSKALLLFSGRDVLEAYVTDNDYRVDGVTPLGILEDAPEQTDAEPVVKQSFEQAVKKMSTLTNLCLCALPLGITDVAIDEGTAWAKTIPLAKFAEIGKVDNTKKPALILNAEELKQLQEAQKEGKPTQIQVKLRFNPFRIEDYVNDYAVTKERGEAIVKQIFGREEKEYFDDLLHNNTLFENIFLATYIGRSLIPQAKEKKPQDIPYFQSRIELLSRIAASKLKQYKVLYIMGDKGTHTPKLNGDNVIVAYTDRFRYMLGKKFEYIRVDGYDEAMNAARKAGAKGILATDGPSGCVIRIPVPAEKTEQ